MAKTIDWMYARKSCKTCQAAQGFLDEHEIAPARETVNASKDRLGDAEAVKLARSVDRVVATKGKAIVTLDLKKDKPSDEQLVALLIGPTGNLRAPTLKVGKTLLVGFSDETYSATFGV